MKIIPKKSLGQNFLIDKNIIEKICNAGNVSEKNNVLEIGPGTGKLTEAIILKKPQKFIVIEKDKSLIKNLNEIYNNYSQENYTNMFMKYHGPKIGEIMEKLGQKEMLLELQDLDSQRSNIYREFYSNI